MIVYKDILRLLSEHGWSAYRLTKEKQIPSSTLDRIRHGMPITTVTLDTICKLCECQPCDIIEWIPDAGEN